MKKIIFTLMTIAVFGTAIAQKTEFGIKGGANFSTLSGESSNSNKISFLIGGFVQINLNNKFAIQPELIFTRQGANNSITPGNLNLDYILIPVMSIYQVNNIFYLEFGPQVGFLVSSKIKNGNATVNLSELTNTIDFGLNFGFGFNLSEVVSVGARYGLGLTNVFQPKYNSQEKNSVINMTVNIKF